MAEAVAKVSTDDVFATNTRAPDQAIESRVPFERVSQSLSDIDSLSLEMEAQTLALMNIYGIHQLSRLAVNRMIEPCRTLAKQEFLFRSLKLVSDVDPKHCYREKKNMTCNENVENISASSDSSQSTKATDEARPTVLPMPELPGLSGLQMESVDPRLYEGYRGYTLEKFIATNQRAERIFETYLSAYRTVVWMYRITFGVGVISFLISIIFALYSSQWVFPLIFGSISIVTFVTIFLYKPPELLEQGLEFPTWLETIQNFGTLRAAYLTDVSTISAALVDICNDTTQQIERIIDKRQELLDRREKRESKDKYIERK